MFIRAGISVFDIITGLCVDLDISEETVDHLFTLYGTGCETILRLSEQIPGGKEQVCGHAPDIVAQVQYAVIHEMANTLLDVVLRRTEIGLGPALKTEECEKIVNTMAACLNWDESKKKMELESYFIDRAKREQR